MHLRDAFDSDPTRGERLTAEAAGLHLDYSKHRVTDDTLQLLRRLATERGLPEKVQAMFRGEPVNTSEGRPALHVALRMPRFRSLVVDGVDVVKEVHSELDRMSAFAERVRTGEWVGATGRPIGAVVNIGIGGSDLGPAMAYEALGSVRVARELTARFVSNVDPADLAGALTGLEPAETLFVVVSKTMSTLETIENARAAREWAAAALGPDADLTTHFVGVAGDAGSRASASASRPRACFASGTGSAGRTSLCSAVGLSLLVALGDESFRALLDGSHAMDDHFATAALGGNLPGDLRPARGVVSQLHGRGDDGGRALQPRASSVPRLPPAALDGVEREVGHGGRRAREVESGSVLWGGPGTNAQHAFFQLLHQGTALVPVDLIGFARSAEESAERHDLLAANLLAQAEALAFGRTADELEDAGAPEETIPHRVMPGNRPSSVLLAERLTPATLGALVALYEHSVFTQAAIWGINPFDQWGVELGKELASRIAPGARGRLEARAAPRLVHQCADPPLPGLAGWPVARSCSSSATP